MNNIILTSDLHIDNWHSYEPSPDYRLSEYDFLAKRYVQLINEKQASWIFFCGDLINTPYIAPNAFHKLWELFKYIHSHTNAYIGFIDGNHDVADKEYGDRPDLTFITTLTDIDPNRIFYLHNKIVNIAGKTIYCCNWMPVEEYKCPDCNIFLGHVSLGFGQDIVGNYDIAFAGDIHTIETHGKAHTLGTALQLYPDQMVDGGVITCVDVDTYNFEYIPTSGLLDDGTEHKFLNLKETEEYKSIIAKRLESEAEAAEYENLSSQSLQLMEDLEATVKSNGLEAIHNRIDKSGQPAPISFDFAIDTAHISNFRSIQELELDMKQYQPIIYINAPNGVGKSVLLSSLIIAMTGDRSMNAYNRDVHGDGTEVYECRTDITLKYVGNTYRIVRGPGVLEFYINDIQKTENNKRVLESVIYQNLPFLAYINFFYLRANGHLFELNDRLEFFKVCFNLNIYDYYAQQSRELDKQINRHIREMQGSIASLTDRINDHNNKITELMNQNQNAGGVIEDENALNEQIKTVEVLQDNLNKCLTNILLNESEIKNTKEKLSALSSWNKDRVLSELENLKAVNKYHQDLDSYNASKNTITLKISSLQKAIESVNPYMSLDLVSELAYHEAYDKYALECETFNNEVKRLSTIANTKLDFIHCSNCGTDIPLDAELVNKVNEAKDKLSKMVAPVAPTTVTCYFRTTQECKNMIEQVNSSKQIFDQINSLNAELASLVEPVKPTEIPRAFGTEAEYDQLLQSLDNLANVQKYYDDKVAENEQEKAKQKEIEQSIMNIAGADPKAFIEGLRARIRNAAEMKVRQQHIDSMTYDRDKLVSEVDNINKQIEDDKAAIKENIRYAALFDVANKNSIPYNMLDKIARNLSSEDIKITTTADADDGSSYFYISIRMRDPSGAWRNYDEASDGQKCIMDMYVLNKITTMMGSVGLLILDESLANLSPSNYNTALTYINNLKVGKCLITSHNPSMVLLGSRITFNLTKERGTHIVNQTL